MGLNCQEEVSLVAPEAEEDTIRRDFAFGQRVIFSLLRVRTLPGKQDFNQRRVLDEVSNALGREGPDAYVPSVCTNWKQGIVPPRDTIRELAWILEVDPGWLAFGEEESAAPVPSGWAQSEQAARIRAEDIDRRRADVSVKRVRKTVKRRRA